MSNNSIAISPFTMPAALAAADLYLRGPSGIRLEWTADAGNVEQGAWLETFRRRADAARDLPEVHRHATAASEDHVAWLKAEGWDAEVVQGAPGDLFLAATINVVAKWVETGRAYKDHNGVDRVLLKKGAEQLRVAGVHPAVVVQTQHPSFAFLFQQQVSAPSSPNELLARADELLARALMSTRFTFEGVHLDFPMADLHVKDDARYMIGLRSGDLVVSAAAEQLRLELNEVGGRASAAAEVAVTRSFRMGPQTVYIDGPFMVAVIRLNALKDTDRIAFAAYVDRDSWKRPADGRI